MCRICGIMGPLFTGLVYKVKKMREVVVFFETENGASPAIKEKRSLKSFCQKEIEKKER